MLTNWNLNKNFKSKRKTSARGWGKQQPPWLSWEVGKTLEGKNRPKRVDLLLLGTAAGTVRDSLGTPLPFFFFFFFFTGGILEAWRAQRNQIFIVFSSLTAYGKSWKS